MNNFAKKISTATAQKKNEGEAAHTETVFRKAPPQQHENLPSTSKRGPISSYANKLLNKNAT